MRDAASGDGVALRRLYDALAPKIVAYLRLRGAEDPEGLTNDVFLAVFTRLDRLTGGWTGFRALTFTIAHSRAVDDLRRQARQPRHSEYDAEHDGRADSSAEQQALAGMDDGEASQLLALLPDEQRTVVMLRVLGDLSVAQTALALRTTEARVKKLQQRAVLALRGLVSTSESAPKDLDEVGR
ncbi:RNA polymerase sigma factor [Nocardioides marmorisolisilvae]|uniref:RNA polymerase sigma factor n=1 Tax=Nocardioides marmorisolisilvae TaxID=1542737 RepID=UPI0016224D3B|nr:RNA polymerase sigma factor [Nocardioides marmorisolisilvae]